MTDFEYLFALFGLLFGLIVAELALRFADAIDSHRERPMGILTPALALLVLTDMTSYWLFLWGYRASLHVSFTTVFSGIILAMIYFLAASLVFPRDATRYAHLDDHYLRRKRLVAGGVLLVNVIVIGAMLSRTRPEWNDWWFYYYFPAYVFALAGLVVSRSRKIDLALLALALSVNLTSGFDLLPHSRFGQATGIVPHADVPSRTRSG